MPEEIVARVLRLPGYGVYAWEANEAANTLTLSIRQTTGEPYYICGGCGISVREIHSWTERWIRDLPWGTWTVWLHVEVDRVRCRRRGVRAERLPFVAGKAHYTTRLEVSATSCLAAAAGPPRRWRPDPSHSLMRRRASLARDREYKAERTSRDRIGPDRLTH